MEGNSWQFYIVSEQDSGRELLAIFSFTRFSITKRKCSVEPEILRFLKSGIKLDESRQHITPIYKQLTLG